MSDTAIVSAPEFDERYDYEYVGNGKWKKIPRAARFDELQKVIARVERLEKLLRNIQFDFKSVNFDGDYVWGDDDV